MSSRGFVFTDVAKQAKIDFTHGGPGRTSFQVDSREDFERRIVPYLGSGISFSDIDRDGQLDLYIANAGPDHAGGALYINRGDGTFSRIRESGTEIPAMTMHAAWGDYDNDGYPDLYLINYGRNRLLHNEQNSTFKDVTEQTGTGDPAWGMGGGFVDFDHDGDLDIVVANFITPPDSFKGRSFPDDFPGAPNVLLQNNGDGSFTDVSRKSGVGGAEEKSLAMLASDLNNTRDVDLLFLNHGSPSRIWNNMRDGTFRPVTPLGSQPVSFNPGLGAGDISRDGMNDLFVPAQKTEYLGILLNQGHNRFKAAGLLDEPPDGPVTNSQFFDFDNDGDLDLLIVSAPIFSDPARLGSAPNLYLYENRQGRFEDVSSKAGLRRIAGLPVRGISIADYDNDGDLDFAVSVNGGRPLLLRNDGGNRNNWLTIRPVGTNSNKTGYGIKAEIKVGRHFQKLENFGVQGFLTQNPPLVHFGLGQYDRADVVRIIWPNGVLQSEIDRPVNRTVEIQELDRKGTSCPIMYVWDGSSYRFQTDFLGGSAFGSLLAPGVYNYPDTDEYIKLNSEDLSLRDGHLFITMNNQLEEVIFFDQLQLVVVDHLADFDVFPDEKLLPGPPYQPFRLFTVQSARLPVSAVDKQGRSVLAEISKIDRIYPPVPDALPFKGYTVPHDIVLDLGEASNNYTVLLMHAWIDYADSTSNLAASQSGTQLIPPYLQVLDQNGNWVTVIERMGFPAGLPKTMTVDLSGKFLSSERKIRIVTNMKIYWDQILVEDGSPRSELKLHRLNADRAELRYRGFPKPYSPDDRLPKAYDYTRDSSPEWKTHIGAYTRFGDVIPLLESRDDMYVITRSGDEIEAGFDLRGLPQLPEGWVRDYLVYVDGFGKDMDPNSAAPTFLGPLPFHAMSSFPYPDHERYPDTEAHREYLRTWNTRIVEKPIPDLKLSAPE